MTVIAPRDFRSDLDYSLAASTETFWEAVYRKAFINMLACEQVSDLDQQKRGIDRIIYLANGHTLTIDEKKREREYQDILLEYTSNHERNTPGWIEKDLAIDYLAYGFMQSRRCYLFPWPMLRRAWLRFGSEWRKKYRPVVAATWVGGNSYHTISVPVPIAVLQRAITTATVIDVSDQFEQVK